MVKSYTITKRISKYGKQSVIAIPQVLEKELMPGTIAEIKITILKKAGETEKVEEVTV